MCGIDSKAFLYLIQSVHRFLCQVLQTQAMILLTSSSLGSSGVGANSFLCLAQILTHALIYLSSREARQELPCFNVAGDWPAVRWDCPVWWHMVINIFLQDNILKSCCISSYVFSNEICSDHSFVCRLLCSNTTLIVSVPTTRLSGELASHLQVRYICSKP